MIAPYLLRPIIVLGLLALAAGPASTLVNLRRAEFGAETMVHGVFPGIVVGMAVGGCWNGEGRHAVWRCRPCRFCCVVAVSYSPTTYRLQYHWRCRA